MLERLARWQLQVILELGLIIAAATSLEAQHIEEHERTNRVQHRRQLSQKRHVQKIQKKNEEPRKDKQTLLAKSQDASRNVSCSFSSHS